MNRAQSEVYSFSMKLPTSDVDYIEKVNGKGLLDLEALIGVVSVNTSVELNSIQSLTTLTVTGDQGGLRKAISAIFNQLNTIKELKYENQSHIGRINTLELKMIDLRRKLEWKLEQQSARAAHYEKQANNLCKGKEVVVPFDVSGSDESDSESSSSSGLTYEFSSHRQTVFDQKLQKRQKENKSALSSKMMKVYLRKFFDVCPEAPDEISTSISEVRTAFIRFVKKNNPIFRKMVSTHGFIAQFTAHLKNAYNRFLVEDEDGNLSLKIVIDWPTS